MKKYSLVVLCTLCSFILISQTVSERIHVDQFGYLPIGSKVAVISNPIVGYNSGESYSPGATFKVIDVSNDTEVFSGPVTIWNGGATHGQSGDKGWWCDFTDFSTPGTYYILDETNNTKSYDFDISNDVYASVLQAATKMFYYNRCNDSKDASYAGDNWVDGMNFENDLQDFNARYVWDQGNAALEKDLSGGWFDAGDYNKYVTFAMDPIHNLLSAFEENNSVFGDNWNIPESGNGIPDLLDEVIWELDWLERMANEDGSVHIKMGSISYSDNGENPPSENVDPRYYGPTCSSASIAVAGMFAHASNVFEDVPGLESYAVTLKDIAVDCWANVADQLDTGVLDLDCDDGTIKSGDADVSWNGQYEYALVAAVHLFEITGDDIYDDFIAEHLGYAEMIQNGWWGGYKVVLAEALLYYTSLPQADLTIKNDIINSITPHVSQDWNGFYGFNEDDLYRAFIPGGDYVWGSNMVKANYGLLNKMVIKYGINPSEDDNYEQKAHEQIHYFHGINPLGMVMLSNMSEYGAENSANEIYHTWFADGSDYDHAINSPNGPAPGFLVGGPNVYYTNPNLSPPYGQPAQKSYLEFNPFTVPENAWEITEPGIYYQAAYIRLLASFAPESTEEPVACEVEKITMFDASWEGWLDGGSDARRSTKDAAYAYSGNRCVRLRDDSFTSNVTSSAMTLGTSEEIKISFTYITSSMDDSSEGFFLELSTDNGSNFNQVDSWYLNVDFANEERHFVDLLIPGSFTDQTIIRFVCDGSSNNDFVYIDDVQVESCGFNGGCTQFDYNEFDLSWGNWNDGGSDARRSPQDAAYAYSGSRCVRLRDGSATSNMTTNNLDLSLFTEVDIDFTFISSGLEAGEGLILEYSLNGGVSYSEAGSWIVLDDFNNEVRVFETVNLAATFTSETAFRFRSTGSDNNDFLYIDDIEITACGTSSLLSTSNSSDFRKAKDGQLGFDLFPNPTRVGERISIHINSSEPTVEIQLIDMLGNIIHTQEVGHDSFSKDEIATTNLHSGTYFVIVESKHQRRIKKLLISN